MEVKSNGGGTSDSVLEKSEIKGESNNADKNNDDKNKNNDNEDNNDINNFSWQDLVEKLQCTKDMPIDRLICLNFMTYDVNSIEDFITLCKIFTVKQRNKKETKLYRQYSE